MWKSGRKCGRLSGLVFKGTYGHRIDAKGRLPVPAPFRRALVSAHGRGAGDASAGLVLTPLDQCIAAYPLREWSRLEAQLRALPAFSRPAKALTRLLASRAVDCPLDVQGRILIPSQLREQSALMRDVLVVGVIDRFEIWAPERWQAFVRESEHLLGDVGLDVGWPTDPAAMGAVAGTSLEVPAADPSAAPPRPKRPQAKPKP